MAESLQRRPSHEGGPPQDKGNKTLKQNKQNKQRNRGHLVEDLPERVEAGSCKQGYVRGVFPAWKVDELPLWCLMKMTACFPAPP